MLEKKIKRAILEAKDNQERILIEEKLVKSRILMIVESKSNIKNFHKLPKQKQEKIAYSILDEIRFLDENSILNEQLMDVLGKIFGGNILSSMTQTIVEPMVKSLVSKLGLGGFFTNAITSFLVTDPKRLALALKDCKEFTKIIVEALSEALVQMLQEKQGLEGKGYDFLRNALGASVKGTTFMTNLENQLSGIICQIFNGFNKKATEVHSKLTPEVATT